MGKYIIFLWVWVKDIERKLGGTLETFMDAFWKVKNHYSCWRKWVIYIHDSFDCGLFEPLVAIQIFIHNFTILSSLPLITEILFWGFLSIYSSWDMPHFWVACLDSVALPLPLCQLMKDIVLYFCDLHPWKALLSYGLLHFAFYNFEHILQDMFGFGLYAFFCAISTKSVFVLDIVT